LVKCQAICNYPAQPDGPGGTMPRMQCLGDADECVTNLCNTTGWSAACVKNLDDLLACLPGADPSLFYCSANDTDHPVTLDGHLSFDFAAFGTCEDTFNAWSACL
jgi:hypothetical protein